MAMLFDTTARVDKLSAGAKQWTEGKDKPHTRIEIKISYTQQGILKSDRPFSGVELHKTDK